MLQVPDSYLDPRIRKFVEEQPEKVEELKKLYFEWAKRCGVLEFDDLRALRQPKFRARREAEQKANLKAET